MEKEIKDKFTIYKITNLLNDKIYVGAHITKNVNDRYFGSSKHLKKDISQLGKENFYKEILFVFDNKFEMLNKEAEIVNKEFCYRTDTYNRMVGGITGSFSYKGMINVKDSDGNNLKVYIDDPRYLSGELKQVTKGTVPVKDVYGNNFRVSKNDSRYLSGELVFNCTGKVVVKDKIGNIYSVIKNDDRISSGELSHVCKGHVTVKDKKGNHFNVDKNDPRYISGELIHNLKDTIVVKDKDGKRFCVKKDNPKYLSGELVGWAKGRPGIKGMLGKEVTEECKENLRNKAKLRTGEKSSTYGKIAINNGVLNKKVKKEEVDTWTQGGWILGMILKKTKEDIIAAAKKYSTKKDFRINDSKNYSYACKQGWINDCFKHIN